MKDRHHVEAILDRFREWLESSADPANGDGWTEPGRARVPDSSPPGREFGIIDLVEEFTALRQELKLQTKSGRGLIDQTETTVSTLRQAIEQFRAVEARLSQAAGAAGRSLAEALADLDEALDRGRRELDRARARIATEPVRELEGALQDLFGSHSWLRRRWLRGYHAQVLDVVGRAGLRRDDLFDSLLEGFGLIQKRLKRVMATEQIERIDCEGAGVNPEQMNVIDVIDDPRYPPGTVVKELRRGYTWKGRVIRYADVQAARAAPRSAAPVDANSLAAANRDSDGESADTIGAIFLDSD